MGIVGATVMPHAIYLHSGLTQDRAPARDLSERRLLVRYSNREVILALAVAGAVNAAMVMMASRAFHGGHADVANIEVAYSTLIPLFGGAAAGIFLVSLMASGISSSVVGDDGWAGDHAGVCRLAHSGLAASAGDDAAGRVAVVAAGWDATRSLVISQVVLSLVLPVPMVALVVLSRRRDVMGVMRTGTGMFALAIAATAATLALNVILLVQAAFPS